MESKKQKYIKFLNEHDGFQEWIRNSPMQIVGFSVVEDPKDEALKVQLLFRNSLYLFQEESKVETQEGKFLPNFHD